MRTYDLKDLSRILQKPQSTLIVSLKNFATPKAVGNTHKYLLSEDEARMFCSKLGKEWMFDMNKDILPEEHFRQETQEAHPLVTDKRWLKTSEFPDVSLSWEDEL